MDDWEIEMRNELARMFRETVPEGRRDPVLDENGKDMTHPLYGKTHMESSKKKMAEAAKGNTKRRGSKHTSESIKLMSEVKKGKVSWAHTWIVTTPEGKEMTIYNLKKFCRRHNLHQGNFVGWGSTKGYTARRAS
tara:strand:+ start:88 stop:492 length:405 start_codon:yes stop_codon:yes gene_type:complete